jgi:hypothetical protein
MLEGGLKRSVCCASAGEVGLMASLERAALRLLPVTAFVRGNFDCKLIAGYLQQFASTHWIVSR